VKGHGHPDADYDVVVAGGGPAGLAAALIAAMADARVMVITGGAERNRDTGAVLALPVENRDWVSATGARKDHLIQVSRALPVVRRWISSVAKRTGGLETKESTGRPAVEWTAGSDLVPALVQWLREELLARHNTHWMDGHLVSEVQTCEDRVIGVSVVAEGGKRWRVRAPRAILCTGGISGLVSEDRDQDCGSALCVAGMVGARMAMTRELVVCPPASVNDGGWRPAPEEDALRNDPMCYYRNLGADARAGAAGSGTRGAREPAAVSSTDTPHETPMEPPYPIAYRSLVDVDPTGETTIEGLYLAGLARGWSPFEGRAVGIPLINALVSGVISGQAAATAPPDPALALSVQTDEQGSTVCTDTDLPGGFAREKRKRLAGVMRQAILGFPTPLEREAARVEVLKLRGEARDFKRFRDAPELWRLYHACEASLILLSP
jgi:succinate dehydrogenase/fumarate reductase flavoprotein subunit